MDILCHDDIVSTRYSKMEHKSKKATYHKEYYQKNKDRILEQHKEYYNRPEVKKHKKEWHKKYYVTYYAKNKEWLNKEKREWRRENRKEFNRRMCERRKEIKIEVMTYYSEGDLKCVGFGGECNENRINRLSIDHINGDGAARRRSGIEPGSGKELYGWLKKNNYPTGYQTLCMNCQRDKQITNKEHGKSNFMKE